MNGSGTELLIGVINAGSSSLKFSFYAGDKRVLAGQVDGIAVHPRASAVGAEGEAIAPPELGRLIPKSPGRVLTSLLPWAQVRLRGRKLDVLGHRVVHGGQRYS